MAESSPTIANGLFEDVKSGGEPFYVPTSYDVPFTLNTVALWLVFVIGKDLIVLT